MKNKRTLIILCSILLFVIIIIIGFAYGYINTKIDENNNIYSVKGKTGKSELTLKILSDETEAPKLIEPGFVDTKVFTVTNTGNAKEIYNIYLDDVTNTFVRTGDVVYYLYKKENASTINADNLDNNDIVATGQFPVSNAYIKINESINEGVTNAYALKIEYKNLDVNQDENKGKIFSSKVQISTDITNSFKNGTLAYKILDSAINVTKEEKDNNYAEFKTIPDTVPCKEESTLDESELSVTEDNYGYTYYFRGNVQNNYLNFNNMCFRIVRIEGDGSIKLVLASSLGKCNTEGTLTETSGFIKDSNGNNVIKHYGRLDYYRKNAAGEEYQIGILGDFLNGTNASQNVEIAPTKTALDNWIINKSFDTSKLKNDTWDLGNTKDVYNNWPGTKVELTSDMVDSDGIAYSSAKEYLMDNKTIFNYLTGKRLSRDKKATLVSEENSDTFNSYAGLLMIDEMLFGGAIDSIRSNMSSYLYSNATSWYLLSHSSFSGNNQTDYVYMVRSDGIASSAATYTNPIRASITLKTNINYISGNGTILSPYEVE